MQELLNKIIYWTIGDFDVFIKIIIILFFIEITYSIFLKHYKYRILNITKLYIGELVIIIIGNLCDKIVIEDMGRIRDIAILFYITDDIKHIVKNISKLGVKIPNVIKSLKNIKRGDE